MKQSAFHIHEEWTNCIVLAGTRHRQMDNIYAKTGKSKRSLLDFHDRSINVKIHTCTMRTAASCPSKTFLAIS
jgi:hypothetical protein